jgi:sphingomyelin phosphodiesterase acid-like 3
MLQLSRRTFIEFASLASAGLIGGCGGTAPANGSKDFPVLVFSDVHFQPFINPLLPSNKPNPATVVANIALVTQLDAADVSQWPAIFGGAANATNSTPSAPGTDTNYALLTLALTSIKQNLGTSPAVLFTGDFLGHAIDQLYPLYSANKSSAEAAAFVDKTLTFVLQQIRAACGDVPVLFAVGNCDSYTGYGPDSTFLANNASQLYSTLLSGAAEEQDFLSTFTAGGYYAAEPLGKNLMVISLNTMPFSPLVQASGDASETDEAAVDAELAWFDSKLAAAQAAGQNVWLLMHAPPGADEATTANNITSAGHLAAATMMWETELSGYVHADTSEVSGSYRDDACRPYPHGRISDRAAKHTARDYTRHKSGLHQQSGLQDLHSRSKYTRTGRLYLHQLRPLHQTSAVQ